jgi:hypothetical protein
MTPVSLAGSEPAGYRRCPASCGWLGADGVEPVNCPARLIMMMLVAAGVAADLRCCQPLRPVRRFRSSQLPRQDGGVVTAP